LFSSGKGEERSLVYDFGVLGALKWWEYRRGRERETESERGEILVCS